MRYWFFLIICFVVVAPVSAGMYVNQNDKLYWGDVADLTGVYGWQCTLAWWESSSQSDYPTRTVDVCSNSYNIAITPERFPAGDWYKWDGKVGRHGNDLAFTVVGSMRPEANLTGNLSANITTASPTPIIIYVTPNTTAPTPTPQIVYITVTVTPVPTPTQEPGFVMPNLPPLPIIIILVVFLILGIRWWLQGAL